MSASGDDDIEFTRLVRARRRADFLYYPSSTFGYNHGHAALYSRRGRLIEAANAELGVRSIGVRVRRVPKGETYILDYRFARGRFLRRAMVSHARSWVGEPYRGWLRPNRTVESPYNCSQLVWAVYRLQGWDLDDGEGTYVFPIDVATADGVFYYKKV